MRDPDVPRCFQNGTHFKTSDFPVVNTIKTGFRGQETARGWGKHLLTSTNTTNNRFKPVQPSRWYSERWVKCTMSGLATAASPPPSSPPLTNQQIDIVFIYRRASPRFTSPPSTDGSKSPTCCLKTKPPRTLAARLLTAFSFASATSCCVCFYDISRESGLLNTATDLGLSRTRQHTHNNATSCLPDMAIYASSLSWMKFNKRRS